MIDWAIYGDFATTPTNIWAMALALLLAFICGHAIAWVYAKTHSGLSYSKTFVNALLVIPVIVALVMNVLQNNLVTAFGMMAVFAIVRFRNVLRDTMDTTYVLSVIAIGMACGTQKYATAVIGCALIVSMILYLYYTSYGSRNRYDVVINLHWARAIADLEELRQLFVRHSRKAQCASQRSHEGYEGTDMSYRVLLRDPSRVEELLAELRSLKGVSRVTSLQAQEESEL